MDPDCGVNGHIVYSFPSGVGSEWFTIKETTGQICIYKKLDHETLDLYEFPVVATDIGNLTFSRQEIKRRENISQLSLNLSERIFASFVYCFLCASAYIVELS